MPKKKERLFDSVDEFFPARYTPGDRKVLYESAWERLRGLERSMAEAEGQLVLVIRRESEVIERGRTGCFGSTPDWTNTKEYLSLGVLTSPRLILRITEEPLEDGSPYVDSDISLPTKRYVSAWYGMGWNTELKEGSIPEGPLMPYALYLDEPLTHDATFFKPKKKLEVIVGNHALNAWAPDSGHALLLHRMLRMLPEDVTLPSLEAAAKRERERLAVSVERLWLDLMRYRRRVDAVAKAGRENVGAISLDGISVTVCENEDDAFFISWGDRERATEAKRRLQQTLGEIRELGGLSDDLPNVHLIRHITGQLSYDWS